MEKSGMLVWLMSRLNFLLVTNGKEVDGICGVKGIRSVLVDIVSGRPFPSKMSSVRLGRKSANVDEL